MHDWFTLRRKKGLPVLSSRRLLDTLEALPANSAYKKALRDGDFSDEEYILTGILNELRLVRVDQAAIAGQPMKPTLVQSPAQKVMSEQEAANNRLIQQTISQRLRRETT